MSAMSNEKMCPTTFRDFLRNDYRIFEEQQRKKKEAERADYSDLEDELQRKFQELFGDDDD